MTAPAVIMTDTAGCIIYWTEEAQELFGYPKEFAMGQSLDLIVPVQYRDAHWRGFHRAMSAPRIKDLVSDMPVLCADGSTRYFAGRLVVVMDALATAVGAVAIFTDQGEVGFRAFSFTQGDNFG